MKHFLIVTNQLKDPRSVWTEKIRAHLERSGCTCSVYAGEISGERWKTILSEEREKAAAALEKAKEGLQKFLINK